MRLFTNFAAHCLLAIIALTASPAAAQFAADYQKPAMVNPAWFAGVVPIAIDRPLQPSGLKVSSVDPCAGPTLCVAYFGWMFDYSSSFVQAKTAPLNKGALRKLEASAKKFPHQQQWRLEIAQAYLRAGRFDLFFPEINSQLATWYSSPHALMMRAETLAMLGREDLAMADVKSAEYWAWQRKYVKQGTAYYHHHDTTDVLALKAEILARMGKKREASFALVDANANVDRNETWPSHLARVQAANTLVTRLLHSWTPEQLARIDAVLDKWVIADCANMPTEIEQARAALYRLFDVIRLASTAHESCKRWEEAERDASWLVEMGPHATTPMTLEQKVRIWEEGSDRMAIALEAQGKHKEAQRTWSTMLSVGMNDSWTRGINRKLDASIAAGRAKGIEPEPSVLASLGNAKTQIAAAEYAEATAKRIAAEDELSRQARTIAPPNSGSSDPWVRLDSFLTACKGMMSDVSSVHPAYGQWRESANRCENTREEAMRLATSTGRADKYSEYQQIRFPWQ
jgi:hypothetical protein